MFLLVPLIMLKTERVELFVLQEIVRALESKRLFSVLREKKIPNMYNLLSRYSEKEQYCLNTRIAEKRSAHS